MDTLHKKLSEIRDLRAEELDLVGGADEYQGDHPTFDTYRYNTNSLQSDGSGNSTYQTDDAYVQTILVDHSPY